jgi:hypothetical protein
MDGFGLGAFSDALIVVFQVKPVWKPALRGRRKWDGWDSKISNVEFRISNGGVDF